MESTEMKDQLGSPLAIGDDVVVLIGTRDARMQLGKVSQVNSATEIEITYEYRSWFASKDDESRTLSVIRHPEDVVKVAPEKRP